MKCRAVVLGDVVRAAALPRTEGVAHPVLIPVGNVIVLRIEEIEDLDIDLDDFVLPPGLQVEDIGRPKPGRGVIVEGVLAECSESQAAIEALR